MVAKAWYLLDIFHSDLHCVLCVSAVEINHRGTETQRITAGNVYTRLARRSASVVKRGDWQSATKAL
jgi:hypothetical protein